MLQLLADENFSGDILRGLFLRRPDLDISRVQDVGLAGAGDPEILAWAAEEGRIILTQTAQQCRRMRLGGWPRESDAWRIPPERPVSSR